MIERTAGNDVQWCMPVRSQQRYALGFSAAALVLALVGAVVVSISMRLVDDYRWVTHTQEVLTQIENIYALEREAISSQRGHLLIDDSELRDEFWTAGAEARLSLAALQKLVSENGGQQRRLDELRTMTEKRLNLAARAIEIHDREGLAATQAYIRANGVRELDDDIRRLVGEMRGAERQLLGERTGESRDSARWLVLTASLGIPLSLIILATMYVLLHREFRTRQAAEQAARTYNEELATSVGRLQSLSADMSRLSHYASMLQSCSDMDEALEITRQSLSALLPSLAGTIYLLRASRDHLLPATTWGTHLAPSSALPDPLDCWALRRNQAYSTRELHADVKCGHVEVPAGNGSLATACLPLSAHGEALGLLYLSGPGPGPLSGLALAEAAAEQLSLALGNLRLRESLREQSIRDPLTGLFNRRYLEESLARELARASRRGKPVAVLMMDVDHFKAFNDRHGHAGGDALLAAFGRLLQENCRSEDISCRYGGEEFTMILPEMTRQEALARAEAVRSAAEALVVEHMGAPLNRVTVSIGLAMHPDDATAARPLMEAADAALYRAKAGGRNRVVEATTAG